MFNRSDLNKRKYNFHFPGIYFLFKGNELVYVGRTLSVHNRILQHYQNGRYFDTFIAASMKGAPADSLAAAEQALIPALSPTQNSAGLSNFEHIKKRETDRFARDYSNISSSVREETVDDSASRQTYAKVAEIPDVLTINETCKYLHMSRATVHRMIKLGRIKVTRVLGRPRIQRRELERLLKEGEEPSGVFA